MNFKELVFGVHKTFSAIRFLEENQVEEAKEALLVAVHIFKKFLTIEEQLKFVPIAHEIISANDMAQGEGWFLQESLHNDIVILRQLLPIEEYALFSAKAVEALTLWKDKTYAQKQLKSALETLSYEVVTLSF